MPNSIRFPPAGKPGVIILRPALPLLSQLRQLAMEAIAYMKTESPRDSIWIIEPGRIRLFKAEVDAG
jgi:hypothetical protein